MAELLMLIGVPGSGKSTWVKENCDPLAFNLISSDNFIEEAAKKDGVTYNEAFQKYIKKATEDMNKMAKYAFDNDRNVVWDQTNLTIKSRKAKLAMVPSHYKKTAVFFTTPAADEHKRRLDSRPGKTIPYHILKNMAETMDPPSYQEGWDNIILQEN
jgi:predicted kinase